jgi:hypothetical protein
LASSEWRASIKPAIANHLGQSKMHRFRFENIDGAAGGGWLLLQPVLLMSAIIYDFKSIGGALRKQRIDDWWQAARVRRKGAGAGRGPASSSQPRTGPIPSARPEPEGAPPPWIKSPAHRSDCAERRRHSTIEVCSPAGRLLTLLRHW